MCCPSPASFLEPVDITGLRVQRVKARGSDIGQTCLGTHPFVRVSRAAIVQSCMRSSSGQRLVEIHMFVFREMGVRSLVRALPLRSLFVLGPLMFGNSHMQMLSMLVVRHTHHEVLASWSVSRAQVGGSNAWPLPCDETLGWCGGTQPGSQDSSSVAPQRLSTISGGRRRE